MCQLQLKNFIYTFKIDKRREALFAKSAFEFQMINITDSEIVERLENSHHAPYLKGKMEQKRKSYFLSNWACYASEKCGEMKKMLFSTFDKFILNAKKKTMK